MSNTLSATWRDEVWNNLGQAWDVIVIGGGITGAGIFQQAARMGLRVLLVEQRDFAWGTSSRSSKMVHGGLRYLKDGNIMLTYESVREREKLLEAGPGLIEPLGFLIATYKGDKPGKLMYSLGLTVYDLLALNWSHQRYSPEDFQMLAPHIAKTDLQGGFRYGDALTDDARLVMRVLQEGLRAGGVAINYTSAVDVLRDGDKVVGVKLHDVAADRTAEARAKVVISATGAWADELRSRVGAEKRLRPLRGSHLVFPAWKFSVAQAITFLHPFDHRPVYAYPWEGMTLVGTTDIDHDTPLNTEPGISPQEVSYLMAAVQDQFPGLNITLDDVVATWAGVRPVVDTGKADPSKESREYAVWDENGLLTVTGGKLTTFRLMALDTLKAARKIAPDLPAADEKLPPLQPVSAETTERLKQVAPDLDSALRSRLLGRYADDAPDVAAAAQPGELNLIAGTRTVWAELRWAARAEGVVHLDDLMLRRTRIGLLLANGGEDHLGRIRAICQAELGWSDEKWASEQSAYVALWRKSYSLPPRESIPDWTAELEEAHAQAVAQKEDVQQTKSKHRITRVAVPIGLSLAALLLMRRRGKK